MPKIPGRPVSMKVYCCGNYRGTPFCAQCGRKLDGDLKKLYAHLVNKASMAEKAFTKRGGTYNRREWEQYTGWANQVLKVLEPDAPEQQ
jgi:hypothetical protein